MRRVDDGRTWATMALEADDREAAVRYWQKVFGEEYFPADVEEATAGLAAEGMPGSAFVTGAGLIVAGAAAAAASTPVRQTRFHGPEE